MNRKMKMAAMNKNKKRKTKNLLNNNKSKPR